MKNLFFLPISGLLFFAVSTCFSMEPDTSGSSMPRKHRSYGLHVFVHACSNDLHKGGVLLLSKIRGLQDAGMLDAALGEKDSYGDNPLQCAIRLHCYRAVYYFLHGPVRHTMPCDSVHKDPFVFLCPIMLLQKNKDRMCAFDMALTERDHLAIAHLPKSVTWLYANARDIVTLLEGYKDKLFLDALRKNRFGEARQLLKGCVHLAQHDALYNAAVEILDLQVSIYQSYGPEELLKQAVAFRHELTGESEAQEVQPVEAMGDRACDGDDDEGEVSVEQMVAWYAKMRLAHEEQAKIMACKK